MRVGYCIGLWLFATSALAASPSDPFPQIATAYIVELNGEAIWAGHPDKRLPLASLTKLMSALLILEKHSLDDIVDIKPGATHETGTRMGLKLGEQFHLHDLLASALMLSANDACHALADHVAGNESAFVKIMNQRAIELGMHDTHFVNACGHDSVDHYSTTHDLSLLAHALLKYPSLIVITSQKHLQITTLDGLHRYTLNNKNALIGRYEGTLGLKTGFTPNAGKCLVAYVRRGDNTVLLVLLHGKDRWWDAVDVLDLAFDRARDAH